MTTTRVRTERFNLRNAWLLAGLAVASSLLGRSARAAVAAEPVEPAVVPPQPDVVKETPTDPTGGAYTSPTLLFIPAAAVPVWSIRVIASSEVQNPADVDAKFRPGFGAELGLQAVIGTDFATTDADGAAHAYAVYRPIPQLALGAAGQARRALVWQPGEPAYDIVGGGIASLTVGRFQVGALGGGSTLGLNQGQAGGLAQLFVSARFL